MKISNKVWQMTPSGYELIAENARDYDGPITQAKGVGNILNPLSGFTESGTDGAGFFDPGGKLNHVLDPGDLFGGDEKAAAGQAAKDLPGQLSALNQLQANVARYNTSGPFGSTSWSIDPTTGRYTQNMQLNPSEQRQFDTRNQIAEQMLNKAQSFAPASSGSFDYNSEVPALTDKQYAKTSSLTAPIQQQNQASWEAKMANAGISPGSDAYKEAAAQRNTDLGQAQSQARASATTAAIPLAQQQRQQRMTELAQLIGGQQLNSPALGGTGVDIGGATDTANRVGIANANTSAAQRNANLQSLAGLMSIAYPNGFG